MVKLILIKSPDEWATTKLGHLPFTRKILFEQNTCNGTGFSWCAALPGPSLSRLRWKQKQTKMAVERRGVNLMLVLSLMEADDSVVENEMLLEDNSTLLLTAVI